MSAAARRATRPADRSRSRRRPPPTPRRARRPRRSPRRGPSASRRRGHTSRGRARTRRSTGDRGGASNAPRCPPKRARAASSWNRPRASPRADRSAGSPNRASASGCRGRWTTGWRTSGPSFAASRTSGPNSRRQARPSAPPRPVRGGRDGPLEDGRPAAVERVGDRRVRVDELDAARREVDRGEERRGDRQRQDRRADVVAEPGEGQLGGPRPATGRRRGLVDADRAPGTGQGDGGGQAVRPGPDDDRVDRAVATRAAHGTRGLTPGRSACGWAP